jgi:hypothetical protein
MEICVPPLWGAHLAYPQLGPPPSVAFSAQRTACREAVSLFPYSYGPPRSSATAEVEAGGYSRDGCMTTSTAKGPRGIEIRESEESRVCKGLGVRANQETREAKRSRGGVDHSKSRRRLEKTRYDKGARRHSHQRPLSFPGLLISLIGWLAHLTSASQSERRCAWKMEPRGTRRPA